MVGPLQDGGKRKTDDIEKRRKLIEFIATLGGLLAVVVSVNPLLLQTQPARIFFSIMLFTFIVSAILTYHSLLFRGKGPSYTLDVFLFSLSLSGMLTIALAVPLAEGLGASPLTGDEAYEVFGVITVMFFAMFNVLMRSILKIPDRGD